MAKTQPILTCRTCNEVIVRTGNTCGTRPKYCNDVCNRAHPDSIAKKHASRAAYKVIQNERRSDRRLDADYRRNERFEKRLALAKRLVSSMRYPKWA